MPLRIGVDLEEDDLSELHSVEESLSGLAELEATIAKLSEDQRELNQRNLELQRLCAQIVQREKLQSVANATVTEERHEKDSGANDAENSAAENDTEKKHHFEETLELIRAAQHRLVRQRTEAEHIAADLQARLDDKKHKADEIGKTFKIFKRSIFVTHFLKELIFQGDFIQGGRQSHREDDSSVYRNSSRSDTKGVSPRGSSSSKYRAKNGVEEVGEGTEVTGTAC